VDAPARGSRARCHAGSFICALFLKPRSYDQRIALDGAPAETVDAEAKDLAGKQLARLAARKAAKKAAETAGPAAVKPKHAPAPAPPTKTPEQLRDRVRAALLRRRA
jgi:sRNA-binding protein